MPDTSIDLVRHTSKIQDLPDLIRLWGTTDPYAEFPSATLYWRLVPAVQHGRCLTYTQGPRTVALVTWGFFTAEEFKTREYWGPDVFARETGEVLAVVDMIAQCSVFSVCRDLRRFFKEGWPDVALIEAHRGPRNGWFPNKGG